MPGYFAITSLYPSPRFLNVGAPLGPAAEPARRPLGDVAADLFLVHGHMDGLIG
jgi:hypothetical protein